MTPMDSVDPKPCVDCQQLFAPTFIMAFDKPCFVSRRCDDCDSKLAAAQAQDEIIAEQKKVTDAWNALTPKIYRESDTTRFPKQLQKLVAAFDTNRDRGFGFSGRAGSCKTRAAYQMLKVAHFAGRSCAGIDGVRFGALSIDQFDDEPLRGYLNLDGHKKTIGTEAKDKLRRLAEVDWLLLDDIDKGKFTPRAEEALFSLLEARTSNDKPTLWTCNSNASALAGLFSTERADAILRRLVEFADVVALG